MSGQDVGFAPKTRQGDRDPPRSAPTRAVRRFARRLGRKLRSLEAGSLLPELAALGCLLLLPWAGITAALHYAYTTTETTAVRSTSNLARALEESARRTVSQIDSILLSERAMQAAEGERFIFRDWARNQTLPDKMTVQIATTDRTGHVVASTIAEPAATTIDDRAHFQAQLDPRHDDLFISHPVTGRLSKLQTIQFSRKILTPDGDFAGVAVLSLGAEELSRFYQTMEIGNGFVSILSTDGTILSQGPWMADRIGASVLGNREYHAVLNEQAGSLRLTSAGGQSTISSFRRLRDYPLIVVVGFDTATVFAPYYVLRNNALLCGIVLTVAVGLLGFFWVRLKRRSLLSRRALTITLDTISQGILMVDGQGEVSVINPRVLDLLAWPDEAPETAMGLVASRAAELIPEPANPSLRDSKVETTLETGAIIEVRTHMLTGGGFVQTYTDVTEQRRAHAQVQHLAHHDALTGLANRVELRNRVTEVVAAGPNARSVTALIMIDLDGFKEVNDSLGHNAGDELLIEVSRRLRQIARGSAVVARLGGDEFVILNTGLARREDSLPLAERVLRRLAEPMQVLGHQLRIGASLGLAFHPSDGLDADTLLKHADMALYSAKTAGRGVYRCFDEQLSLAAADHRMLEIDLRRALAADALEVHFQPKFNAQTLKIVGFEALARWRHPTRGYVPPDRFIRMAENCGLINCLGRWILDQACKSLTTWEPRLPVAVNVSVMQLHDDGLRDEIAAILAQHGLTSSELAIEVTESVLAGEDRTVLANLEAIKAMGIAIALDDFGTGYSSLSYLRRFSFDKIKIDRSFVQGQAGDPRVGVILEAILGMCHSLGLATIAEGVETQEQLQVLRGQGCTEIQGYLLGKPMPAGQVQDFIRNNLALPALTN